MEYEEIVSKAEADSTEEADSDSKANQRSSILSPARQSEFSSPGKNSGNISRDLSPD
jgi:hypothetical protein